MGSQSCAHRISLLVGQTGNASRRWRSRISLHSTPTTIIKQFSKQNFTSHSSISNGMQGLFIQSNVSQSPSFLWWEPIKASHTQEQNEKFQFHTTFCKKKIWKHLILDIHGIQYVYIKIMQRKWENKYGLCFHIIEIISEMGLRLPQGLWERGGRICKLP